MDGNMNIKDEFAEASQSQGRVSIALQEMLRFPKAKVLLGTNDYQINPYRPSYLNAPHDKTILCQIMFGEVSEKKGYLSTKSNPYFVICHNLHGVMTRGFTQ